MAADLTCWQVSLLTYMTGHHQWRASDLAVLVSPVASHRARVSAATAQLKAMERMGLVEAERSERPAIWRITEAGRMALRAANERP